MFINVWAFNVGQTSYADAVFYVQNYMSNRRRRHFVCEQLMLVKNCASIRSIDLGLYKTTMVSCYTDV